MNLWKRWGKINIFRLIKAQRSRGNEILLWARDEFGDKIHFIIDFKPFFYVPAFESVNTNLINGNDWGYESVFGEELRKVFVNNPSSVPIARELFTKTFEADIPYARRFLISKKIKAYFKVKGSEIIGDGDPNFSEID